MRAGHRSPVPARLRWFCPGWQRVFGHTPSKTGTFCPANQTPTHLGGTFVKGILMKKITAPRTSANVISDTDSK